jgi:hypothetical protein
MEHPQETELRRLCDQVKVRSANHTSFSVLAMAVTIVLGVLCILSDFVVRKAVFFFQRRTGHGIDKHQQWTDSSAFQLQRMAAEGAGIGPWKGTKDDVPTLVDSGLLFSLTRQQQTYNINDRSDQVSLDVAGIRYRALDKGNGC